MVSSMKGIGIKNCDNCLNEEQTADVNDIPTIRNNVEQVEDDLGTLAENLDTEFDNVYGSIVQVGNTVKKWIEIPFADATEFELYKTKILNGTVLNYDIIIKFKNNSSEDYSTEFISKNTDINYYYISVITYKRSSINSIPYIYSECYRAGVKALFIAPGQVPSSKIQIGFSDDENNTVLKTNSTSNLSRSNFKIYVFANENDLED